MTKPSELTIIQYAFAASLLIDFFYVTRGRLWGSQAIPVFYILLLPVLKSAIYSALIFWGTVKKKILCVYLLFAISLFWLVLAFYVNFFGNVIRTPNYLYLIIISFQSIIVSFIFFPAPMRWIKGGSDIEDVFN